MRWGHGIETWETPTHHEQMEESGPTIKAKNKLSKRKEKIQKCMVSAEFKGKEHFMKGLVSSTKCHRELEMRTENSPWDLAKKRAAFSADKETGARWECMEWWVLGRKWNEGGLLLKSLTRGDFSKMSWKRWTFLYPTEEQLNSNALANALCLKSGN